MDGALRGDEGLDRPGLCYLIGDVVVQLSAMQPW